MRKIKTRQNKKEFTERFQTAVDPHPPPLRMVPIIKFGITTLPLREVIKNDLSTVNLTVRGEGGGVIPLGTDHKQM